jgi:hypothetical protein
VLRAAPGATRGEEGTRLNSHVLPKQAPPQALVLNTHKSLLPVSKASDTGWGGVPMVILM